jgi:hypothetical protein
LCDILCCSPFAQQLQQERDNKRRQRQLFNKLSPLVQQFFESKYQSSSAEEYSQLEEILVRAFGSNYDIKMAENQIYNQYDYNVYQFLDKAKITKVDSDLHTKNIHIFYNYYILLSKLFSYLKGKGECVQRMSSPPPDAYVYRGHSNLDIKESSQSYGISFESRGPPPLTRAEQFKQYLVRIEKELFASLK